MGNYIFPYIQKCLEILPDQFKIAYSAPDKLSTYCALPIPLQLYNCYYFLLWKFYIKKIWTSADGGHVCFVKLVYIVLDTWEILLCPT